MEKKKRAPNRISRPGAKNGASISEFQIVPVVPDLRNRRRGETDLYRLCQCRLAVKRSNLWLRFSSVRQHCWQILAFIDILFPWLESWEFALSSSPIIINDAIGFAAKLSSGRILLLFYALFF